MRRSPTLARSRLPALVLGLLAATGAPVWAGAGPGLTPSINRGAQVAQARCASCHGVALETASPSPDAPLFRVLSRLYSAQDLERKLFNISQNGHFEMPAVSIREDEIEDVSAYIASLDGGGARTPRRPRPTVTVAWKWMQVRGR
jgi:cytochrome c